MPQMELRAHAVEWNTKPNAPFWTHGPGVGPQKNIDGVAFVDSFVRSEPDGWRLVRLPQSVIVWMRGSDLIPTEPGGDPAYHAAVVKVMDQGAAALGSGIPKADHDAALEQNAALKERQSRALTSAEATVAALRS